MKFTFGQRQRALFAVFSVVFIAIAYWGTEAVHSLYKEQLLREQRNDLNKSVALVRARIEALIFRETYIADSMATVVGFAPEQVIRDWPSIARRLDKKSEIARNIGLAPNNVVQYVYPEKGNRSAIGFDLRTNPEQFMTVLRAIELQDVYVTNPVDLVQGGKGIIARFPIFTDVPENRDYWGTISVVIDFDEFIKLVGLNSISGAEIALRGHIESDDDREVIFGSVETFNQADIQLPIAIPNGEWLLAAKYGLTIDNLPFWQRHIARIIAWVIAGVLFLSLLTFWRSTLIHRSVARQDELTGLPNRRHFMEVLNRQLASRRPRHFTLLNIDLNGFKKVNDVYGHQAGDELLRLIANELRASIRIYDEVARVGGDEFLVILHRLVDPERVRDKVAKIRQTVENHPLEWQGDKIYPSLSIGSYIYTGENISAQEILTHADKKMYQEKRRTT
ncbi:diguanylate cyclase domain-containing protein [Pseudidiomarina insulisalsae]|uniref:Sensor domain-containing diguanylate cyclase n=1 Tax=Pseudidiomarina insulisalsae TaxID=575789 RepID=A0A432YLF0_9GAMM|nr:diguanylate cyclase [Pseudidiomarina insulisalsae]RUO61811.1 sensor domain-containing diguanylate cyclase [Pseudidiomarina insulisalsae]